MPAAVLLNSEDPLFVFENMMAHRQYFPVMSDLSGFSVLPYELDPASETQIPASMWNLSHQQAHNDFNSDLPDTNNDGYTITIVTPPVATGTGAVTTASTSIAVSGVTNTILVGSTVAGTGIPAATKVVSGPGGAGSYIVSQPVTLAVATALTFTHPPYQQANVVSGGSFGIPQGQSLLEGSGLTTGNRSWWTFLNHQEHFIANEAILPYPATAPTIVGTPPGQATASNPWWWAQRAPLKYPFW